MPVNTTNDSIRTRTESLRFEQGLVTDPDRSVDRVVGAPAQAWSDDE